MFASITDEEVKEFTDKLDNENTKMKTLYDMKVFLKNILTPETRKGKLKISRRGTANLFLLCERKMVKNTNPLPSERLSKASTGIFGKTTMDSPCLTTRNFTKCKIF